MCDGPNPRGARLRTKIRVAEIMNFKLQRLNRDMSERTQAEKPYRGNRHTGEAALYPERLFGLVL
jgi:hypothetical protein